MSWKKGTFELLTALLVESTYLLNIWCNCSGFRAASIQAVKAATRRSMQLGGTSEDEIINKYNL